MEVPLWEREQDNPFSHLLFFDHNQSAISRHSVPHFFIQNPHSQADVSDSYGSIFHFFSLSQVVLFFHTP